MTEELKGKIIGFLAWLAGASAEQRGQPEVAEQAQALLDEIDEEDSQDES